MADNEGSSPEPGQEREARRREKDGEEDLAPGEQEAEREGQEGSVALGGVLEEGGVAPSKSQEDTAEAAVGTDKQMMNAQQTQVGRRCMNCSH